VASEMARRVPAGTRKEDFLPFVRAAIQHFDAGQDRALAADAAADSFAIANEQLQYRADFARLAGRDFDPSRDGVDRAEVESLPLTPTPAPALREITVECLECGATYPIAKAHLVDDGGMGCMRCNH
jgi:hypothetical protein